MVGRRTFSTLAVVACESGFTSGLHVSAIRGDREEYSGKFVFYVSWSVLAFQVRASVVFLRRFLLWYLLVTDKSCLIHENVLMISLSVNDTKI